MIRPPLVFCIFMALCLMASCSSPESADTFKSAKVFMPPMGPKISSDSYPAPSDIELSQSIGPGLSLQEALNQAKANSPELRIAEFQIQAQQEQLAVAGHLPNPELSARVEAVPISSPRSGQEALLGFTQAIPISGQLGKSEDLEQARLETLQIAAAHASRQLEAEVRGAFATALALQNAVELQNGRGKIAQASEALLQQRISVGDEISSNLAESRAQRVRLQAQQQEVERRHQIALAELSAVMGMDLNIIPEEKILVLESHLSDVLALPQLQNLAEKINSIPSVAEDLSKAKVAKLSAVLAEANQVPMVNLELFYRGRDDAADGFDAGVMFELPLNGHAAANSRAAHMEVKAAEQRGALSQRHALLNLKRYHVNLSIAMERVQQYQSEFIPGAKQQLKVGEARLQAGDISLAEVLPMRSQLIQVQLDELQSWHQLMSAWAEITPFLP